MSSTCKQRSPTNFGVEASPSCGSNNLQKQGSRECCSQPSCLRRELASKNHRRGASSWPYTGLWRNILVLESAPNNASASDGNFTHNFRSCGRPCKKAVETSADHPVHPRQLLKLKNRFLPRRVDAGEEVSSEPANASTSAYPLTTRRAFARGLPSAFLLHLSRFCL